MNGEGGRGSPSSPPLSSPERDEKEMAMVHVGRRVMFFSQNAQVN